MTSKEMQRLASARKLIMSGQPVSAVAQLEAFMESLVKGKLHSADRPGIEAKLTELHQLAEAAMAGTRSALDHINALVEEARSLQTYDQSGRRKVARAITGSAKRL